MTWVEAVLAAINRVCDWKGSDYFTLQELKENELSRITQETGSSTKYSAAQLRATLQELRDADHVEFVSRGEYFRIRWEA